MDKNRILAVAHLHPAPGDDQPIDPFALAERNLATERYSELLILRSNALISSVTPGNSLVERSLLPISEQVRPRRYQEPFVYQARRQTRRDRYYYGDDNVFQRRSFTDTPRHSDGTWSGVVTTEITDSHNGFSKYSPRIELKVERDKPKMLRLDWHFFESSSRTVDIPGIDVFPNLRELILLIQDSSYEYGLPANGFFSLEIDIQRLLRGKRGAISILGNQFHPSFEQIGLSGNPIDWELDVRSHRHKRVMLRHGKEEDSYTLTARDTLSRQLKDVNFGREKMLQTASEILGLIPTSPARNYALDPLIEAVDLASLVPNNAESISVDEIGTRAAKALNQVVSSMGMNPDTITSDSYYVSGGDNSLGFGWGSHFELSEDRDLIGVISSLQIPEYPINLGGQGWEIDLIRTWEQTLARSGVRKFAYTPSTFTEQERTFWESLGYQKAEHMNIMIRSI